MISYNYTFMEENKQNDKIILTPILNGRNQYESFPICGQFLFYYYFYSEQIY
jgi:hypothetical protein